MKTNTETSRRDPIEVALLWTAAAGFAIALALSSTFAPLFYIWAIGLLGCVGIVAAVAFAASTFGSADNDPIDDYFALQAVFGGMRLIGVILLALTGVPVSSND
jgi:hypothetical protein